MLAFFLDYKKRVATRFAVLFDGGGGTTALGEKWGWYPVIFNLANESLLAMDAVTELQAEVVFQHLAFLRDHNHEMKRQ